MNPSTFFTTLIVVLFLYAIWDTWSKLGKIFVVYEGKDKTVQMKWLKKDRDDQVVIDNKRFTILPECVQSAWDYKGIHMLLPTKVNYVHLVWYSKFPTNPNNYTLSWDTPAFRKMFNLEYITKSFFRNYTPSDNQKKKQQTGWMQYIPLIAIVVLVVVVAFYLNSQMDGIKNVINMMENQIKTLSPK